MVFETVCGTLRAGSSLCLGSHAPPFRGCLGGAEGGASGFRARGGGSGGSSAPRSGPRHGGSLVQETASSSALVSLESPLFAVPLGTDHRRVAGWGGRSPSGLAERPGGGVECRQVSSQYRVPVPVGR